ncbi:MAG: hypothetical protein EXR50_07250 [Dehalococcoidia bacterium]|nr:hypothetical protein [Dehalococcoidia bacterium]
MNTFEATTYCFRLAANVIDLSERVHALLINPDGEVKVEFSLQLDNGELAIIEGFRKQHNNCRGPMEGGLRYHPDVDSEEAKGLASLIT